MADTSCYTVVAQDDERDTVSVQDLKTQLESPKDDVKIEAMKRLLVLMLNGDPAPGLLMHIIRFVTPSKNKTLKKLSLIYWEICPKYQANGKLKQEMVLVWFVLDAPRPSGPSMFTRCFRIFRFYWISAFGTNSNAIRNDILHPNEWLRGVTLRFLCKLKEPEILEPLVPAVRQCLVSFRSGRTAKSLCIDTNMDFNRNIDTRT